MTFKGKLEYLAADFDEAGELLMDRLELPLGRTVSMLCRGMGAVFCGAGAIVARLASWHSGPGCCTETAAEAQT